MKKLLFILPLLYYSCTDDIIADIDALQTENAEQDAQIDSLMTALNEQQAYIDSLIGESSINDSLIQEYTDSLNTVQNAYIDSLHNAQQTLLGQIVSTNTGFTPTQVYSGSITTTWTDLDLSSVVGNKASLVILEIVNWTCSACSGDRMYFRTNGDDFEPWTGGGATSMNSINQASFGTTQPNAMILITSDSNGIVELRAMRNTQNATISVVFYLN